MTDLKIPVGISDFAKIRKYNYYYVDKTGLIADLLEKETAEVTLITRPRRFGKTMGMSMLANFFDIRKDSQAMFEGLEISKNTALCSEWMNQWPTLFLSFKKVDGLNFQDAYDMLTVVLANLYKKHMYLLESDKINPFDKDAVENACSSANKNSLSFLPVLGAGEAILMGVDFPMPVVLKVNKPIVEPNSATPQFVLP